MEPDVFEVLLSHGKDIGGVSQEHVASLPVACHILVFALLEIVEFGVVVAFYPAGLVEVDGFPAAAGVVFVLQPVLNDFELQLTDGADNLPAIELVDKELGYTLVHELLNTFFELFGTHGVVVFNIFEHLRRE